MHREGNYWLVTRTSALGSYVEFVIKDRKRGCVDQYDSFGKSSTDYIKENPIL